jgi:MFS transporter, ACS family, allantoate permease
MWLKLIYPAVSNIIVKSFGYTSKQALILSAPGGVFAGGMTLFVGWYSDKYV